MVKRVPLLVRFLLMSCLEPHQRKLAQTHKMSLTEYSDVWGPRLWKSPVISGFLELGESSDLPQHFLLVQSLFERKMWFLMQSAFLPLLPALSISARKPLRHSCRGQLPLKELKRASLSWENDVNYLENATKIALPGCFRELGNWVLPSPHWLALLDRVVTEFYFK